MNFEPGMALDYITGGLFHGCDEMFFRARSRLASGAGGWQDRAGTHRRRVACTDNRMICATVPLTFLSAIVRCRR